MGEVKPFRTPQLRVRSLDGMRGMAAGIVVLHHMSMTIPAVSNGYDNVKDLPPFSPEWWAVASPFKIFLAGPEFVLVFFALSGFVLTLSPLARGEKVGATGTGTLREYSWSAYYPRRILRLGVPVVASMVLALIVNNALPHPSSAADGSWLDRQAHPDMSLHNIVTQTLLIVNTSRPSINPPLWSLTWEMWFSLLLPAAVLIAVWSKKMPILWGLLLLEVSVWGYLENAPGREFLPAFVLGAMLAANADKIRAFCDRRRSAFLINLSWSAITLTGAMAMISYWLFRAFVSTHTSDFLMSLRVPGALLLVAAAAFWPAAGRLLTLRPFAALGRVSFSLYLVHSPVIVAFGLIFTGAQWWIGMLLALAVITGLTLGMYRFVEVPSQRLASWAGKRAAAVRDAMAEPVKKAIAALSS